MEMRNYIKKKRAKKDFCNICGRKRNLTWDHVPPKAIGNHYQIDTNTLLNGMPTKNDYQERYQSGIKYRSICDDCNNAILGKYDITYRNVCEQIISLFNSDIYLSKVINIPVEINKLCRAICGHMLASKNFFDTDCSIDIELREYVLNPSIPMKSSLKLYYWIYLYNSICIARDSVVKGFKKDVFPDNMVSLMAAFPLGFLLDSEEDNQCGLNDLFKYTTSNINDIIDIPINFNSVYYPNSNVERHFMWPFIVSDQEYGASFIIGGDSLATDSRIGVAKKK